MMLRITEYHENSNVRLRLDGTLTEESFADLERACGEPARKREILILDMAGVSFMNEQAGRKLTALQRESVQIINCSPFIAALLETVERPKR